MKELSLFNFEPEQKETVKVDSLFNDEKTLFVCSHSGGKDSQAMYLYLKTKNIKNLVVIHADLNEVEWAGTFEHIQKTISPEDQLFKVKAEKSFLEMVKARGMFPSSKTRQCTSDLKTAPIFKKIYELAKLSGYTTIVNCMGLRAEESKSREAKARFELDEKRTLKKGTRTVYTWLPIHDWSTKAVFSYIKLNNQMPHDAYLKGMSRLSCCFCIMANRQDLKISAEHNPELLDKIEALENEIGHAMFFVSGLAVKIKDYINTPYKREPKKLKTWANCQD